MLNVVEFDDYAEIVDDDPDYAHPMAGRLLKLVEKTCLIVIIVGTVVE